MKTPNTPTADDARSPDPPQKPTTRVRQFSGFVAFFKIGWVMACCFLLAIAVVGLEFLENQARMQWLLVLLGTVCVFPLGWGFLKYLETRLRELSSTTGSIPSAMQRSDERAVKWMGRVTFLVIGVLSLSAGLTCVITEHVFIDGQWTKVTALNAWILGGLSIIFSVICFLALFPADKSRNGLDHDREKEDTPS